MPVTDAIAALTQYHLAVMTFLTTPMPVLVVCGLAASLALSGLRSH